jgi:hypothetical protein
MVRAILHRILYKIEGFAQKIYANVAGKWRGKILIFFNEEFEKEA